MIKIGICDDDTAIHEQVKKVVCGHDFAAQMEITSFMNGQELLEYDGEIDILLLDICMPGADGIEVGRLLKENQRVGKIIMLTSMVERIVETFEFDAYRGVKKPIDGEKLIKAIEETIETFIGSDSIEVYLENVKYTFLQREIIYISRTGPRTEVVVGNTAFQSALTLGEWEKVLDERMFFQVHKSYIVNLSQIDSVEEQIVLKSEEVLPVAKRRRSELKKRHMYYDLRYR